MLKVLIVSVGKLLGGVESYTVALGTILEEQGYEVHYALRNNSVLYEQITSPNKIVLQMGKNIYSDMKLLSKYVNNNHISIVHCNSNNGIFVSQLIKENAECKKIGVIHGDVVLDQAHKSKVVSTLYSKLETWLVKNKCSHCIAVSDSMKNILMSRGVNNKKISVIYTGIKFMKYQRLPDYNAELLWICSVGNLLPVKNQIALLKALAIIKREYSDIKVKCDIYGEGIEREILEKYIDDEKLINVSLKGFDKKVRMKLGDYALYIHPSKYESFGISVIEAMNAGCCVIANSVGGMIEIVDTNSGFLVNCNNENELVDQIVWCYKNREEIKTVGQYAKENVMRKFSTNLMADNVIKLYKSILYP